MQKTNFNYFPFKSEYLTHLFKNGYITGHYNIYEILKNKFTIYSGRGPSNKTHIGHLFILNIIKEIQKETNQDLIYEISDDEKFYSKDFSESKINEFTQQFIKDFNKIGFNKNTTLFKTSENIDILYKLSKPLYKKLKIKFFKSLFGFSDNSNIGNFIYPLWQTVIANIPSNILIITGIDQIEHFIYLKKLNPLVKIAILFVEYVPNLKKIGKMSSSDKDEEIIFISDAKEQLIKKLGNAYTGAPNTLKEFKKIGLNEKIDVCYNLVKMFNLNVNIEHYKKGLISSFIFKNNVAIELNNYLQQYNKKLTYFKPKKINKWVKENLKNIS